MAALRANGQATWRGGRARKLVGERRKRSMLSARPAARAVYHRKLYAVTITLASCAINVSNQAPLRLPSLTSNLRARASERAMETLGIAVMSPFGNREPRSIEMRRQRPRV